MAQVSETEVLNVKVRERTGTNNARRMCAEGLVPAVIYGHGEETVKLTVAADEIHAALRHGSRVVTLRGGVREDAFIRDVQWDTFGNDLLHIDFTRVTAGESVETTVLLECRGEAPGTHAGGVVEQPLYDLDILCPVREVTDKIEININSLELGDTITVAQLELPRGAKALLDEDTVVVQCVEQRIEEEEEGAAVGPAEPEIIGRKAEEEGAEE